jgi:hypothetical protein
LKETEGKERRCGQECLRKRGVRGNMVVKEMLLNGKKNEEKRGKMKVEIITILIRTNRI